MEYQDFKLKMDELEAFIETCETKEIEGEVHITINEANVDQFREIMEDLISVASSDDNYVEEILEYLSELDKKITDKTMIARFLPLFAAIQALAGAVKSMNPLEVTSDVVLFPPTIDPDLDEWVFELNTLSAPLEARLGKVIDKVKAENGTNIIKIKTPLSNEVIEWEDDTSFVVIPGMEKILKEYQAKYTKIF